MNGLHRKCSGNIGFKSEVHGAKEVQGSRIENTNGCIPLIV